MNAMQRYRRGAGFTITEAIVVMVITSVVMALLLPGLGRARDNAKTAQGLANLQQIGQGVYIMAIDLNNTLPYGYWDGTPVGAPPPANDSETDWMVVLNDYLAGGGSTYKALADGSRQNETLPLFRDPNATNPDQGLHHYIGHPILLPDRDVAEDPARPEVVRYRLTRLRRPDEVVLAMDGIQVASDNVNVINTPAQYTSRATARDIDGSTLDGRPAFAAIYKPFFDPADNDNDNPIDPGANQDGYLDESNNVFNPANTFDIRWRQHNDSAANFVFPDGHSETLGMNNVRKRNIRVD